MKLNNRNWLKNQNKLLKPETYFHKHVSLSLLEDNAKNGINNLKRRIFAFMKRCFWNLPFSLCFYGSFDRSLVSLLVLAAFLLRIISPLCLRWLLEYARGVSFYLAAFHFITFFFKVEVLRRLFEHRMSKKRNSRSNNLTFHYYGCLTLCFHQKSSIWLGHVTWLFSLITHIFVSMFRCPNKWMQINSRWGCTHDSRPSLLSEKKRAGGTWKLNIHN